MKSNSNYNFDFRAFCRDFGIACIEEGHEHVHRGWAQTHCPFCTDGSHGFHLGFKLSTGSFNCWRCGKHSQKEVLTRILGSEAAARQCMARYNTNQPLPPPVIIKKQPTRKRHVWLPPGTGPLKKPHHKYLQKRGYDSEELEDQWDLMGTDHLSIYGWTWRIIIPIYNAEGQLVAYCGRSIKDNIKPKYKMIEDEKMREDPSRLLYGIHKVKDTIVIVEGPADVWKLGPGAVAVLGIDWTEAQACILKDYPKRFIMFDPEKQAQSRAIELGFWLGMYDGETELISDLESDPGDLSQQQARHIMDELRGEQQ